MSTAENSHHNISFAAICVRLPNNALIAAECASLTAGLPEADGFAPCQRVENIPRAAYIRTGLQILVHASNLNQLLETVAQANFPAHEFRIEFSSLSRTHAISPRQAIIALADAIPFYPNLERPQHRFLLVERHSGLCFGEIITESQHSYRIHDTKPYSISSALPSRLSRALVNLVSPPARSLLDPCCGTGSILLQAQSLGLQAYGADQNKTMVWMARANLAHFGYQAHVQHADARTCSQTADALVTNLPYGRLLQAEESTIRAILERGRTLAPQAVYVAEQDISGWLAAAGYPQVTVYPVSKHDGFTRYIHLARG
jgi:tRNA G10  N-methylase Trm11